MCIQASLIFRGLEVVRLIIRLHTSWSNTLYSVVYYSKSRTLLFVEPRLRQRHQLSGLLKFDSGSAAVFAVTDINLK